MPNISIYSRYVIRSIITPQIFCLIILTAIVWLAQILRMIFLFEKNIDFMDFIEVIGFLLPSLVHTILPFATLYASLYVYNSMKINKELVVLENAGFTPAALISPLLKLGAVTALIGIINGAYILPKTYSTMKDRVSYYRSNFTSNLIQEGMFNNLTKNVVLFLNKKNSHTDVEGIILFDYRNSKQQVIMFADKGKINLSHKSMTFDLINGQRQILNGSGSLEVMAFEKFKITINNDKSNNRKFEDRDLQEHYLWELLFPRKITKKSFATMFAEGNNRLVWPLFNLALPLAAISIFLKGEFNRKEYSKQFIKSFIAALIFISFHFVAVRCAAKNEIMNILVYINLLLAFGVYYINSHL